jgi:hypothetical protein
LYELVNRLKIMCVNNQVNCIMEFPTCIAGSSLQLATTGLYTNKLATPSSFTSRKHNSPPSPAPNNKPSKLHSSHQQHNHHHIINKDYTHLQQHDSIIKEKKLSRKPVADNPEKRELNVKELTCDAIFGARVESSHWGHAEPAIWGGIVRSAEIFALDCGEEEEVLALGGEGVPGLDARASLLELLREDEFLETLVHGAAPE